jgi:quinol monooxygenase YgiN
MPDKLGSAAYCVEYFYAKPGCRDQLVVGLLKLIKPTKAEEGCQQYDLLQDSKDPNLVILLVKFTDQETMKAHENSNFIQEFSEGT